MIQDTFDRRGKVAIVAGKSTGRGDAMARGMAEAGADVIIYAWDKTGNKRPSKHRIGARLPGSIKFTSRKRISWT